ncbi:hypothetical protein [Neorhodopirellula pilleata]|uniref:Secreted protein n=1 Tax=Neorhodopirellula pilleata TaxID=2714738 RepID=A0A5C5ZR56_9BACT|nr:hypothetical protein [Neorhodopirellula pilleata]TWT89528.1 hypothetical protein Pla100_54570 [Neorhodopirellula pilleata]
MRCIFAVFLLVLSIGCGGNTAGPVANDDELSAYLSDNPSPDAGDPGTESAEAE